MHLRICRLRSCNATVIWSLWPDCPSNTARDCEHAVLHSRVPAAGRHAPCRAALTCPNHAPRAPSAGAPCCAFPRHRGDLYRLHRGPLGHRFTLASFKRQAFLSVCNMQLYRLSACSGEIVADDGSRESSIQPVPGTVPHAQTHCPWTRYGAAAVFEVAKTAPLSACKPNLTSRRMSCLL